MFIACYLAHDDAHIAVLHERCAMAKPPIVLVTARSAPELINQVQTLPVRVVLVDLAWPRTTWNQVMMSLRTINSDLPVLALSSGPTDHEWWRFADDLLRLDEGIELFLYRLERLSRANRPQQNAIESQAALSQPRVDEPGLLHNAQFRQFAEIFSCAEAPSLLEAFTAWIQQACQANRVVVLLRDPDTGDYCCRAHRGLSSTVAPHCTFSQTAPLCRWLATHCRILLRGDENERPASDVFAGLDLMQAVAAVPMIFDGQLVGIIAIGSRLVGSSYSASELEGLYAFGTHIAVALHHRSTYQAVREHTEMTEHMLSVMPTGIAVVDDKNQIAFINDAAASMVGKGASSLIGSDLRSLPSPLGDLAYESLTRGCDLPRREISLSLTGRPIAVSAHALSTTPSRAMLLIEDLSAQKHFEAERERRVDLEVVTNLVHYLAHELRNPLVSLSTFNNLLPTQAGDPEFQTFCESVLMSEVRRVNLIIEQLLVLTDHAEFKFALVELAPLVDNITGTEELRGVLVTSIPFIPPIYADARRLDTALTCILRTVSKLALPDKSAALYVDADDQKVVLRAEAPVASDVAPEWLLDPWNQLMKGSGQQVDFGLATAQYILEQHSGQMEVKVSNSVLNIICRIPINAGADDLEEDERDAPEGSHRR